MQKDLKIGLAVGSGLVAVVVIWLATRPSLTPQARIKNLHNTETRKEEVVESDTSALGERPDLSGSTRDSAASGNLTPESTSSGLKSRNTPETQPPIRLSDQRENQRPQTPPASIPSGRDTTAQPMRLEQIEPIKTEKFYIVRKNDTLSSISQKYYGSATKWPKIFEANRIIIPDANKLAIGTKLIIPD
jgi:nucleoid-associated protein YgaU